MIRFYYWYQIYLKTGRLCFVLNVIVSFYIQSKDIVKIILIISRSNKDQHKSTSATSTVPLLKSPPDFVRRRPAAFQLKTMSGRAWDPDLLGGSNSSLGNRSRGGSAGPEDVRWATNGDSNKK